MISVFLESALFSFQVRPFLFFSAENPEFSAFIKKSMAVLQKQETEASKKHRLEERKSHEHDCMYKGDLILLCKYLK